MMSPITSLQSVNVVAQLSPDHRKLAQRRIEKVLLSAGVANQKNIQQGNEHQEQREYADKGAVRQVVDQGPRVVISELLHYAKEHRGGSKTLLSGINSSGRSFEGIHSFFLPRASTINHP
jgi:hypothetical protein